MYPRDVKLSAGYLRVFYDGRNVLQLCKYARLMLSSSVYSHSVGASWFRTWLYGCLAHGQQIQVQAHQA